MAEAGTLHDAFIDELRDTYDAERQLTKALPKLAKAATNPKLRKAFETHLEETQEQVKRLERAGCRTTVLPPQADGLLDLDALRNAIQPDTALVSVMSIVAWRSPSGSQSTVMA